MIIEKKFIESGFENIISISGKDITADLIKRCFNLDRVFYGKEFLWENTDILNVILKYNQMCFIFMDTSNENIVGYSYWFPIKTEILDKFVEDKKALLDIKQEYCSGYQTSPINLFLGGEAFVPGYDLLNMHKVVEDIFQHHILHLAENGIKIDNICLDAVCKFDEEYLVPKLGVGNKFEKSNCIYYCGEYHPNTTYKDSQYCEKLKKYY